MLHLRHSVMAADVIIAAIPVLTQTSCMELTYIVIVVRKLFSFSSKLTLLESANHLFCLSIRGHLGGRAEDQTDSLAFLALLRAS